jgi:hypothetical protein
MVNANLRRSARISSLKRRFAAETSRLALSMNSIIAQERLLQHNQLVGRCHARQVWARDPRHFFSRLWRKMLGHTLFDGLRQQRELLPLRTAELLAY